MNKKNVPCKEHFLAKIVPSKEHFIIFAAKFNLVLWKI